MKDFACGSQLATAIQKLLAYGLALAWMAKSKKWKQGTKRKTSNSWRRVAIRL